MSQKEYMQTTIVFPCRDDEVLLGMKKRGFGEGWWNGFGGKLETGETYEASAVRETYEEARIVISDLRQIASLLFFFDDELGVACKAYSAKFTGEPVETEEMRPVLFKDSRLPFGEMWPADKLWLPKALAGGSSLPLGFIIHFDGNKSFRTLKEVDPQEFADFF